jgi:hypothetical protein
VTEPRRLLFGNVKNFATDLDPWLSAPIDLTQSNFDIQSGVTHKGIMVSGSIVSRCQVTESYGTGIVGDRRSRHDLAADRNPEPTGTGWRTLPFASTGSGYERARRLVIGVERRVVVRL